jgi:uncharacterized protein
MVLWFASLLLIGVALLYGLICLVYWLVQDRFIFVRFPLPKAYAFTFDQPFTEEWLHPEEGVELHGLHFTAREPLGTVLYFHGNTGSLRRWGKRASRFTRLGWNVLMMDYRGYGKSKGKLSESALHADALAWYDHLAQRESDERIVIYGRSLGSGMAVPLAAQRKPRALVLESPFANLYDPARHQFFLIPYRWLLRYTFRNDKAIRRVKCPVFIFHGKRDPVVPYESALRLYASVPGDVQREMITFPKGYHSDLGQFSRFQRKLAAILAASPRAQIR